MSIDQTKLLKVLVAEYTYWMESGPSTTQPNLVVDAIRLGALGAVANILAAVHGHPAPWHPKDAQPLEEPCPTSQQ